MVSEDCQVQSITYLDGSEIIISFLDIVRPVMIRVGVDGAYDDGEITIIPVQSKEQAKAYIKDLEQRAKESFKDCDCEDFRD